VSPLGFFVSEDVRITNAIVNKNIGVPPRSMSRGVSTCAKYVGGRDVSVRSLHVVVLLLVTNPASEAIGRVQPNEPDAVIALHALKLAKRSMFALPKRKEPARSVAVVFVPENAVAARTHPVQAG
jgi:hypothetical protein